MGNETQAAAQMPVHVTGWLAEPQAVRSRVLNGEFQTRLRLLNAVSRRLRGLGFGVAGEAVNPPDGGEPVLSLREVSAGRQQILLGLVNANTLHVARRLRTCRLDGVRLAWPDCAPANV